MASKVTSIFNEVLLDEISQQEYKNSSIRQDNQQIDVEVFRKKLFKAVFHVNAFNFPKARLYDYIYYKHICSKRNSLVEATLAFMSDNDRIGKSSDELKSILKEVYDFDYDSSHTSCRFKNGTLCTKLKNREGTSVVIVDIERPLKQGGADKTNIESMMFSLNSMGGIKQQYFI